jgi:putative ABC transport system permease protein
VGASRPTIILLVLLQTVVLSVVGSVLGAVVTSVVLWGRTGLSPSIPFTTAIVVLTSLTATTAAAIPAVMAAYRDPLSVLRIP